MLSQTAEYALRAAIRLARAPIGESLSAEALAEELGLPRNYLSKILHALARAGVVDSVRGPGGGFRLSRPPGETTLLEVAGTFDDLVPGRRCVLGRPECSDANPCSVHDRWVPVAERMARFFETTTLADVATVEAGPHRTVDSAD